MKVSLTEPYKVIYSLYQHEFLGCLFEPYAVQLNHKGELTLLHQTISRQNINDFAEQLDGLDYELAKLMESTQQEVVLKKFSTKKWTANEFFLRIYDNQKGDKLLQETIAGYIESHQIQILDKIKGKPIFIMGNDGNPTWRPIRWMSDTLRIYFHFVKKEDESTHYFPILKCKGERVQIRNNEALLICDEPAHLLVQDQLYEFDRVVDGKKLRPFFSKNHIVIPKKVEDQYYRRFVAPLIAHYDVFAEGFEIKYETDQPKPILTFSEIKSIEPTQTIFVDSPKTADIQESNIVFDLSFRYGSHLFKFDSFANNANVSIEKEDDKYIFHKVKRTLSIEKKHLDFLRSNGLNIKQGKVVLSKFDAIAWLQQWSDILNETGFEICQHSLDSKRYFLGYASIQININENHDWFDVQAIVRFGEFEIPFIKLKNLIINRKKEFVLPNGEIAVIPEAWFGQYAELLSFVDIEEGTAKLKKHHLALIQQLSEDSLAMAVMNRRLEQLYNFDKIESYPLPEGFKGELRPYQKAGYDWLRFLNDYKFGGCLADDMGLGKTVQTLALLLSEKERGVDTPSLLVLPTSLLYNWELEAKKFTPGLRIFTYTGSQRDKQLNDFATHDVILTTYGIVRIDIDILENYRFNYVILDESQAIKNTASNITKAVNQLNTSHRLILTGTPLENSTMDLWSQFTFINPGLLGNQNFFRTKFQIPIEKQNDDSQARKLHALIKPFLLRRHKSQVALDLPPKIENVQYCTMTEAQEEVYEKTKSFYRNLILDQIEKDGVGKSQFSVLQGLTKLRQLANHPLMIDETYKQDSGKLNDIIEKIETIVGQGYKVLIFSQFVKHLTIIKQQLEVLSLQYAYLDGSTTDRQGQVEWFQNDETVKLFLISLKAGGVGLNLTAADYVFVLDPWWNPAIEAQAIDRAHRIGRTGTVFTYKFITKNTVEEKILELQRHKQRLFDGLITTEESFVKALSQEDIMALLT